MSKTVEPTQAVRGLSHFVKLARTGLGEEARGFDKRPLFSGEPIKDVLHCLLVQVAQIVVYARARLVQWNAGGSQLALFAFQSADRMNGAARLWPQTETICALCRQAGGGKAWPNSVSEITKRLFRTHLSANLNGGWIDQGPGERCRHGRLHAGQYALCCRRRMDGAGLVKKPGT